MADVVGWVTPVGKITLFGSVRWDKEHQNAFYFTSQGQLDGYLNSLTHYDFEQTQYTRVEGGIIKVRDTEGHLTNCNYLRFNNGSPLNNKNYYAFIDYTEYSNNNCVIIHYSIDYLTTYWLDISFDHCYILRQHSRTDKVGENIVPEPISIATQAVTSTTHTNVNGVLDNGFGCIVATSRDLDGKTDEPKIYYGLSEVIDSYGSFQGIFQGLYIHCYSALMTKAGAPQTQLFQMMSNGGTESDIRYIIAVPQQVLNMIVTTGGFNSIFNVTLPTMLGEENSTRHEVRNKKLLTSPFTYLSVTGDNTTASYQFENFIKKPQEGESVSFIINGGTLTPDTKIKCSPMGYESCGANNADYVQGISLSSYPMVYWATDNGRTRENISGIIGTLTGGAMTAVGVATENPMAIMGGITSAVTSLSQTIVGNALNTVASGGTSGDTNDMAHGQKEFYFRVVSPSYSDSERIDNFFDLYGYQQNTVAVPDFNARPHYTYVQLATVNVKGLMPENARQDIIAIMRRGCTFWNNATEIGNYNVNNTV